MIVKPLARSWALTHEITSGKWVMSGLFINTIPKVHNSVYEYYLLLNVGLFQILLAISPEPNKIIEQIVYAFTADSWMSKLHEKLLHFTSGGVALSAKDFESFNGLFDVKKLR